MTCRLPAALVIALALTGPAAANCPVSLAESRAGVFVDYGYLVTEYTLLPDGMVSEIERYRSDADDRAYISHSGVAAVRVTDQRGGVDVPGSGSTITFQTPMPALAPNLSAAVNTTVTYDDGTRFNESITIQAGAVVDTGIGPCRYRAFTVDLLSVRTDGGGPELNRFLFLTELGFAIFIGGNAAGEPFDPAEPLSISTLDPDAGTAPAPVKSR